VPTPHYLPEPPLKARHGLDQISQEERDRQKVEEFALCVIVGLAALAVTIWMVANFAA
jgi:hypothetical protein